MQGPRRLGLFRSASTCLTLSLVTTPLLAFNYHEMEVYPWQTEGKGVWEIENFLLFSNGAENTYGSHILRNTLEVNTGLTDWLEVAAYADFERLPGEDWQQTATRLRAHMSFFEKGELPVDIGAYFEVALPKEGKVNWELEGKLILEKDFGRWTVTATPTLEVENEDEEELKPDGTLETETENEMEKSYAMAVSYRFGPDLLPKLSVFDEVKDRDERVTILYPSLDYRVSEHFKLGLGLGFGLSEAAEKRLVNTKVEVEF